jgi:hypothetical protein
MNTEYLQYLSYETILEQVFSSYIKEFGERKFNSILDKIKNSNKIQRLINLSIEKQSPPGSMDFLYLMNEIPFFIFSRGQTQAVGALVALMRWNQDVNSTHLLLTEEGLKIRAIKILEESKATFF